MPCQSDYMMGSNDDDDIKIINELGQYLCFLCGELKHDKLLEKYANKAIIEWWKQHQREDTLRVSKKIRQKYGDKTAKQTADKLIQDARKVHSISRFHIKWFHDLTAKIYDKMSAEKKKKEQQIILAKKAKKKLTLEERKALGIK